MDKKHTFTGKKIEPPNIHSEMTVSELIDFFASTGYNARRLAEAAEIMKDMIDTNSTICLTLAGAMTPIGLGKSIGTLIANGFIDWIVTTGANVYHDLHFAYDLPVRQGHFEVDDDILYSKQIVRIYDVYIKEIETLQSQDYIIQNEFKKKSKEIPKVASTADIAYALGKAVMRIQHTLKNHLLFLHIVRMFRYIYQQSVILQLGLIYFHYYLRKKEYFQM